MSDLAKLLPQPLAKWLAIALRYNGVHEIPGVRNNPQLMGLLDMADGHTVGANSVLDLPVLEV